MAIVHCLTAWMILVPAPTDRPDGWSGQIVMGRKPGTTYREASPTGGMVNGTLMMIEYRVIRDRGGEVLLVENGREVLVRKDELVLQADSLAHYSEMIEKNPNDPNFYAYRGWVWKQRKNLDNALKDYDKAIELAPNQSAWRNNRALIWLDKKDLDKAIADYDQAIQLHPNYALAYRNRGSCWMKKKEYARALADFQKSIELEPNNVNSQNWLARLLAACPEEKFRDGPKALELAKKANEGSNWKNGFFLDTYAAANAEVGDFEAAVKWLEKSFNDPAFVRERGDAARKRLQLYRDKKPYREEPE